MSLAPHPKYSVPQQIPELRQINRQKQNKSSIAISITIVIVLVISVAAILAYLQRPAPKHQSSPSFEYTSNQLERKQMVAAELEKRRLIEEEERQRMIEELLTLRRQQAANAAEASGENTANPAEASGANAAKPTEASGANAAKAPQKAEYIKDLPLQYIGNVTDFTWKNIKPAPKPNSPVFTDSFKDPFTAEIGEQVNTALTDCLLKTYHKSFLTFANMTLSIEVPAKPNKLKLTGITDEDHVLEQTELSAVQKCVKTSVGKIKSPVPKIKFTADMTVNLTSIP